MNNTKIGTLEAILIILLSMVTQTVLSLPKTLIESTNSSILLNLIYITTLVLLIVFFICKLFQKFPGMDILDISEVLGGKFLKFVVGFIFITYFLTSYSIFLRNFCECLKIVYYPSTDLIYVIIFFIFSVCLVNQLEISSSIRTNVFMMPAVIISIFFLFFANLKDFVPERIYPILGNRFQKHFYKWSWKYFCF